MRPRIAQFNQQWQPGGQRTVARGVSLSSFNKDICLKQGLDVRVRCVLPSSPLTRPSRIKRAWEQCVNSLLTSNPGKAFGYDCTGPIPQVGRLTVSRSQRDDPFS
jgi:hypothetical protein